MSSEKFTAKVTVHTPVGVFESPEREFDSEHLEDIKELAHMLKEGVELDYFTLSQEFGDVVFPSEVANQSVYVIDVRDSEGNKVELVVE